jgi:nucleotide-binding universal stress UspA family protein
MTAGAARAAFTIRRIVVAADSTAHGRAAIEAAARLGVRLHADIQGLFVEDINLVHLAHLPLGRELRRISGQTRSFDCSTLEDELRAEAGQARRALEAVSRRAGTTSSFRVVRGRVESEILTAANEADLLILGTASRPIGSRVRAGSAAVAAAERAPISVLLLRPGTVIAGRPLVVYDGSDGALKALDAGVHLTEAHDGALIVLLVAATEKPTRELQNRAEQQLESTGLRPQFSRVTELTLDNLCRLSRDLKTDLLVLSADSPVLMDKAHGHLLERLACPVLLVR